MQRVEVRHAVDAEDHRLAVNDEMPAPVIQGGFDDPGKAAGPIVAAPGVQPNALVLAYDDQAIAVVFDLMQPEVPVRNGLGGGWEARQVRCLGHIPKLVAEKANRESRGLQSGRARGGSRSFRLIRGRYPA